MSNHSDDYYIQQIINNNNNNDLKENSNTNSNKKHKNKSYKYNNYYNNNYNYNNNYYYYNYNNNYNKYDYKNNYYYNNQNDYYYKEYNNKENSLFEPKLQKYINKIDTNSIIIPEHTINLIKDLISNKTECMICNEKINKNSSIWHCNICYTIFHLKCIYEWIKKRNSDNKQKSIKWTCPHCNSNYEEKKYPEYNCFCGKYYTALENNNKHLNTNLIPHGCGLYCNKEICMHIKKCLLPCHPGPHIQCKKKIELKCYCGKKTKIVNCSIESEKEFSCEEICGKQLNCGKLNHICKAICHKGSCEKFLKNNKCYECIAENKEKLYNFLKKTVEKKLNEDIIEARKLTNFASCVTEYIFNGELPCAQHYVPINIEANLKLLLRLFEISGNKLIDNLKTFIPICNAKVENSCNCGNKTQETLCYSLNYPEDILDFLNIVKEKKLDKCSRICKTLKNCKIHRCERICCELRGKHITNYSLQDPNGYHLCLKICGKKLSCGKHTCENYCHKGQCKPCAYIIHEGTLICSCGKTIIEPPYTCGTKVICSYPCSKKRECNHPCPLKCHEGECPPCEELTFKKCYCGKNVVDNVKCGYNGKVMCNQPCGEILPCGIHFCKKICHLHTDEYDKNYICNLTCLRQLNCGHLCKLKCHGETDCDEYACEETVYAYCKCKTLSKSFKCGELKKLNEKSENGKYLLECNEECVKAERLKNINEAFEGLKNLSEAKMKILYPNCNIDGSEEPKKEIPNKYYNNTIKMAQEKIEKVILFEKDLYNNVFNAKNKIVENKNEEEKKDENYNIQIEEEDFDDFNEWLTLYHNIKSTKTKKINKQNKTKQYYLTITEKILKGFYYQKYKLSLIALLLKHNLFVEHKKIKIFHPFKYTILIKNNKSNCYYQNVEESIKNIGKITQNDYYLYEYKEREFYMHFFNKDLGEKMYKIFKLKPLEFNEVYEIFYPEREIKNEDLKLYEKDVEYFNYLNEGYNPKYSNDNKNRWNNIKTEDEELNSDEDGFVTVKKKKNK